jgi:NADH-quinone oxidoreductase subunit C
MTPEKIADILIERFGDKITASNFDSAHPHVCVEAEAWPDVARFLKRDDRLRMNLLRCISSMDVPDEGQLVAVYDLCAARPGETLEALWTMDNVFGVKVKTSRDDPHIPSIADVWATADWHEREAYDLMGIVFDNHPDSVQGSGGAHPRRILCPDDWEGHPLRKDYQFPQSYHGIPAAKESTSSDLVNIEPKQ